MLTLDALLSVGAVPRELALTLEAAPTANRAELRSMRFSSIVSLDFSPAFVIIDANGRQLDMAEPLVLTRANPVVRIHVWNGGRAVRVLDSGLRGVRAVVERSTESLLSIRVVLQGGAPRLSSLLLHGEGDQAETIQIVVPHGYSVAANASDGTAAGGAASGHDWTWWDYLRTVLLGGLVLALVAGLTSCTSVLLPGSAQQRRRGAMRGQYPSPFREARAPLQG
mmetsp:Transcript_2970/g.8382  ORF Transcript_2970/g.8382 Transcript_2970/m.8382 type:complete len:224 (+) Transcript_2970:3-674(+)